MTMYGMNIDDVRQLSTQLSTASSDVHNIVNQLTAKLNSTTWVGPDQQRFSNDWNCQYVVALNNVAAALADASTLAATNAQQQQDASA